MRKKGKIEELVKKGIEKFPQNLKLSLWKRLLDEIAEVQNTKTNEVQNIGNDDNTPNVENVSTPINEDDVTVNLKEMETPINPLWFDTPIQQIISYDTLQGTSQGKYIHM